MLQDWVYSAQISQFELLMFYNTINRRKDSCLYRPIAIAKREEIGLKYRFLCIAEPKFSPIPSSHFVHIEIYKPEKGMPYTTQLHKIQFDPYV